MKEAEVCQWELINRKDYTYRTSCKETFALHDGDVIDNDYTYCPSCGRIIKIATKWPKYRKEEINKFISEMHPSFCDKSIETGYAKCRGICCGKCNNYNQCSHKSKCSKDDLKECLD